MTTFDAQNATVAILYPENRLNANNVLSLLAKISIVLKLSNGTYKLSSGR